MSLDKFIKFEDVKDKKDETVLLIDGHNIAYITVFATIAQDYSDNKEFKIWRNTFLSRFFDIVCELKPTKIVMAFDSKNSWRYDVYDDYKANRKKPSTSKKPLNKKEFNKALQEMIDYFKEHFTNIYTIYEDRCEGDDIIAVLAKYMFTKDNENVIIVSGDSDLNQLTEQTNVRQYNPKWKGDFFNIINPKKELDIKVLTGDKSDNIPPIKRLVGPVKAQKILDNPDGLDWFINEQKTEIEKKTIEENYKRNKTLIDLNYIPTNIKQRILDAYENYDIKPLDTKKVVKSFFTKKLHGVRHQWDKVSGYLKELE